MPVRITAAERVQRSPQEPTSAVASGLAERAKEVSPVAAGHGGPPSSGDREILPRRAVAERRRPRPAGQDTTSALARLGGLVARRPRWVLTLTAAFLTLAVLWGTGVFGSLSPGGFEDPASGSARARALTQERFPASRPDLVLLYSSRTRTVEDARFRRAVETQVAGLPDGAVTSATTYWTARSQALVSEDRHATLATLTLHGDTDDEKTASLEELRTSMHDPGADIRLQVGGDVAVFSDVTEQSQKDIKRAELLSLPLLLVLLVWVFGGLIAAGLPLVIGALVVLGALTLLRAVSMFTDVSVFAVNIIIMLGLGLSIDYALLIVNRFREELGRPASVAVALVRTLGTAGRTVAFSGMTVAVALASLLLFPQPFLRSMGVGGMAAVAVAVVSALTVLPALLAVLGHRVNALRVRRARSAARHRRELPGAWHRLATTVMRRPVPVAAAVVAVLLGLGAPFLGVTFASADHRALPDQAESRIVAERIAVDFPTEGGTPIEVVVRSEVGEPVERAELTRYARALADVPGATSAEVAGVEGDAARILVQMPHADHSTAARRVVGDVREVAPPSGAEVVVGGPTAQLDDLLTGLSETTPWMVAVMVVATVVLLFWGFGSVVLPVKAVLLNVLSLGASFGLIVLVFQEGHLAAPLGITATGTLDPTGPLMMLAVIFGLSMDYEVFLLSRIREIWDHTQDNGYAVAAGLQHTGRIITSAAALFVVVIGAFATSDVLFIKLLGLGMLSAVIIDATLVRTLLVPATMQLMGRANWWAPAPLARLWHRHGFRH